MARFRGNADPVRVHPADQSGRQPPQDARQVVEREEQVVDALGRLEAQRCAAVVVQDGERNRALTIVKSRGTGHSNQVRELTLSDGGVTLTDVFMAQGKALMGVARWEWEQQEQAAQQRTRVASDLKRLQLEVAQAEAVARLQVVQAEMNARSAEISVLALATQSATKLVATDREVLRKMRHGDNESGVVKKRRGVNGRSRSH